MPVNFEIGDPRFLLKERARVKRWLKALAGRYGRRIGEVNYRFTSDEETLALNQEYLNHNTFTDIITFDSSEGQVLNADIVISVERVRENAGLFNEPFEQELRRVMAHGVLHLCGFKDKTPLQKKSMRTEEQKALQLFRNTL